MSSARRVKMKTDLELMESVAERCGFNTRRNADVRGYYGSMGKASLVVEGKDKYDVGFNEEETLADYHGGHANRIMEEVMPAYHKAKAEQNYMSVERTVKGDDGKIRLYIRR